MAERMICKASRNSAVSVRPEVSSDSLYAVTDTPRGVSFFAFFRFFSFVYYYCYYAFNAYKKCSTVKTYQLQKKAASPTAA